MKSIKKYIQILLITLTIILLGYFLNYAHFKYEYAVWKLKSVSTVEEEHVAVSHAIELKIWEYDTNFNTDYLPEGYEHLKEKKVCRIEFWGLLQAHNAYIEIKDEESFKTKMHEYVYKIKR